MFSRERWPRAEFIAKGALNMAPYMAGARDG